MSGEYLAQSKHQISANRLFYGNSAGDNLYQDTR